MDQKQKIILAQIQVDNLIKLANDLQYTAFLTSHLLPIKYELQRQSHLLTSTKDYSRIEQ